jgi:hypothetical protein
MPIERRELLLAGATVATALGAILKRARRGPPRVRPRGRLSGLAHMGRSADRAAKLAQSAILAASAHNTQPWLFCRQADRIEVSSDEARKPSRPWTRSGEKYTSALAARCKICCSRPVRRANIRNLPSRREPWRNRAGSRSRKPWRWSSFRRLPHLFLHCARRSPGVTPIGERLSPIARSAAKCSRNLPGSLSKTPSCGYGS